MNIQRKRLHKLIVQLTDSQLAEVEKVIAHTLEHGVSVPFLNGIPVYDLINKEHMDIISNMNSKPEPPKRIK